MDGPLQFQGVLVDMDGVLIDTERVAERCWRAAELETGWPMPEGFYFTLIGQSMQRIRERLGSVMPADCDVPLFLETANRHYRCALQEEPLVVKEGARELLEELSARGVPVCLATSTFRELAGHKLHLAGLSNLIPHRVCGDEVEQSKPAPDIYLKAASRLGLPAACTLAIEDSGNGLLAALAAGCRVAHVPDLAPVPLEIQARADRIYRSLRVLAEALGRGELIFAPAP